MSSPGLEGVENFHTKNDSLEAATTIALLFIVTLTTGIVMALAEIEKNNFIKNK